MNTRLWRLRPQCYTALPEVAWEPLVHPRRGAFVPWNTTLTPTRFEHLLLRITQAPPQGREEDLDAVEAMLAAVTHIHEPAIKAA
jgi:hypothetical protein